MDKGFHFQVGRNSGRGSSKIPIPTEDLYEIEKDNVVLSLFGNKNVPFFATRISADKLEKIHFWGKKWVIEKWCFLLKKKQY